MSEETRIRVLIAEDHAIVREGLCALINHQNELDAALQAGAVALFVQGRSGFRDSACSPNGTKRS